MFPRPADKRIQGRDPSDITVPSQANESKISGGDVLKFGSRPEWVRRRVKENMREVVVREVS